MVGRVPHRRPKCSFEAPVKRGAGVEGCVGGGVWGVRGRGGRQGTVRAAVQVTKPASGALWAPCKIRMKQRQHSEAITL